MIFAPTGKVVATATVGADGGFEAHAPLPPKGLRASSKARYRARIGSEVSLNLKLVRRMLITRTSTAGSKVTIAGRVIPPLSLKPRDRTITLQRVVACKTVENVATLRPDATGAFHVTVTEPAGATAAVYRLRTRVRISAKSPKSAETFTLPRGVDFK